jgi:hypothetical protein
VNHALRFLEIITQDHAEPGLVFDGPNGTGEQEAEVQFVWHDVVVNVKVTAVPAEEAT